MQFDQNTIILLGVGVLVILTIVYLLCCHHDDEADQFPRKNGRVEKRVLTNKNCAAFLVLCLAGMAGCLYWGFLYGNPKRLTHGTDWQGLVCGYDEAVADKKFLYFCGSPERHAEKAQNVAGKYASFPQFILQGSTTCVASCPKDNTQSIQCLMPAFHNFSLQKSGKLGELTNVETLDLTVTQSVMTQPSYATEEFGGRYCVPDSKLAPALHETVINGPFKSIRGMLAFGGLLDAIFLLALSALLALILSWGYFMMLKRCAGCIIFISMVLASMLLLAIGLVLLWVVFIDPVNPPNDYAKLNPIFSVYEGAEAKTYSIVLGMILTMAGAVIGCLAATSTGHIDEMIGIIDASLECMKDNGSFAFFYPIAQASTIIGIFVFFILSIPYVASLALLDNARIKMDGHSIQGLQRHWSKSYLDNYALTFYVLCCWWILEMYIQYTNFVIAYVVSKWYFVPVEPKKEVNAGLNSLAGGTGKHVKVRVGGLDQAYGDRQGVVQHGPKGEKMLVVPVGRKAPGLARYANVGEQMTYKKKAAKISDAAWVLGGNFAALSKHMGSIAIGAPVIAILRPFRLFSQCLSGFLNRNSPDPMKGPGFDTHPGTANLKGCFALFSACLDQVVGQYSKNAYVELVLGGGKSGHGDGNALGEFGAACEESFKFLVTCGGSVAYLHGAMLMYEAIGCISITAFCGWTVLVVQDKVDWFNDQTSGWYIEDKNASAFAACVVAFVVSYSWMSLWNQSADVLLYCVAWNRRQLHLGHEFDMDHHDIIASPGDVCPNAMRYLIPAYELDAHYEDGVHAHGVGQMGAIIAAMEHGAMSKPGAPNYSTGMGSVFATGTKALGS
jgi:hypothetical protein